MKLCDAGPPCHNHALYRLPMDDWDLCGTCVQQVYGDHSICAECKKSIEEDVRDDFNVNGRWLCRLCYKEWAREEFKKKYPEWSE